MAVSGNGLVDGQGKPLRLLGVDRSGTEYACIQGWGIFDGPNDAASVKAIAAWKVNAVRVPLNEDCWLGINGVPSQYGGANYQQAIANYVSLLNQNGIVAILDLHWAAPGATPATSQLPMPDADHALTFWSQVGAAYKDNLSVVFDLFNEPYPGNNQDTAATWSCVRDGASACNGLLIDQNGNSLSYQAAGMQSMLDAVRQAGAHNVVMVGGPQYSGTLDHWLAYRPADPLNQVAASWHSYNFGGCTTATCWNANVAPTLASVPLITGEIGENDCGSSYVTPLMSWLDQHGGSYLAWTWDTWDCGGGPALITDYAGTPTAYGAGVRDHLLGLAGASAAARASLARAAGDTPRRPASPHRRGGGPADYVDPLTRARRVRHGHRRRTRPLVRPRRRAVRPAARAARR